MAVAPQAHGRCTTASPGLPRAGCADRMPDPGEADAVVPRVPPPKDLSLPAPLPADLAPGAPGLAAKDSQFPADWFCRTMAVGREPCAGMTLWNGQELFR